MFFQGIPVNYSKKCSISIQSVLIGQIKVVQYRENYIKFCFQNLGKDREKKRT